ncbi:MAG: hypothetical protein V8R83_09555 [Candidatus Gastranaerophilaceae bacterium]|jgi:hypothetical protein
MSYIGFMRNTVSHIEKLFNKYMENSKSYPSSLEKEDYKNFVFQMERIHRYGEIEDEKEYKKLMKRLKEHDLTTVVELRKAIK